MSAQLYFKQSVFRSKCLQGQEQHFVQIKVQISPCLTSAIELMTLVLLEPYSTRWTPGKHNIFIETTHRGHALKNHLNQLKRKALVEDAIDPRSPRQLHRVHLISRTLDALLEIHGKLLHHPLETERILPVTHRRTFWQKHMCVWAGNAGNASTGDTYCSRALVLRDGSSGRKCLYSSTSFSMDSSWLCSLFLSPGRVSRMWLVSCYSRWMWRPLVTGQHLSADHRFLRIWNQYV